MPRQVIVPEAVDAVDFRLLNEWQRDFPLVPRPFARIGDVVGCTEAEVIGAYRRLAAQGLVSRIGAVFAPRRLGASALAALAAPPERLEAVAERINREPGINHNYQREHVFNLWFVITAASEVQLHAVVAGIERDTGCAVIVLPLEEEFHIDLGFDLRDDGKGGGHLPARRHGARAATEPIALPGSSACGLDAGERCLIEALQGGLALEAQPFARLAQRVDASEGEVIEAVRRWVDGGLIRRFGVVVRHHELGLGANAMCVWDIPDDEVSALGRQLAREPAVTLCYRRTRVPPEWPYNLFCMIHGSAREEVLAARDALAGRLGLDRFPHAVLFSCRRFKQTGARYLGSKDLIDA